MIGDISIQLARDFTVLVSVRIGEDECLITFDEHTSATREIVTTVYMNGLRPRRNSFVASSETCAGCFQGTSLMSVGGSRNASN